MCSLPPRVLATLGALALALPPAFGQTIVTTGDDLAAVIAAAASGDVIEIRSDATFVGTVGWSGKSLTLRAGEGFQPTLLGDTDLAALRFSGPPQGPPGPTGCVLEGLRLEAGPSTLPLDLALQVSGSDGGSPVTLEVRGCLLKGGLSMGGTGDFFSSGVVEDSTVDGRVSLGGNADGRATCVVRDSWIGGDASAAGTGDFTADLTVLDSTVGGRLVANPISAVTARLEARRCYVAGGVFAYQTSSTGTLEALVESCVLGGAAATDARGFETDDFGDVRGVNLTITGFEFGVQMGAAGELENCLIQGNDTDTFLFGPAPETQIENSLISDGTFDGINGNFQALAVLDCDGAPIPGSPGIDAGDLLAADLGPFDVNGAPRVQDSDGDGAIAVNVGAHEELGALFPPDVALFNGSGINAVALSPASPPLVGQPFQLDVDTTPQTLATLVAVDLPAPVAFPNPFGTGELFLALTPALLTSFQNPGGSHTIPIPDDPALLGVQVRMQGARIENLGPGLIDFEALNAIDLTLGEC